MSDQREAGWYWVRFANSKGKGCWFPAEWDMGKWWAGDDEQMVTNPNIIGPRIEPPKGDDA